MGTQRIRTFSRVPDGTIWVQKEGLRDRKTNMSDHYPATDNPNPLQAQRSGNYYLPRTIEMFHHYPATDNPNPLLPCSISVLPRTTRILCKFKDPGITTCPTQWKCSITIMPQTIWILYNFEDLGITTCPGEFLAND